MMVQISVIGGYSVKKFISFAAALFVIGFAAVSLAIQAEIPADNTSTPAVGKGGTQITIGAEIMVRGVATQNTNMGNGNTVDSGAGKQSATKTHAVPAPKN
jgi:hypothetical protein